VCPNCGHKLLGSGVARAQPSFRVEDTSNSDVSSYTNANTRSSATDEESLLPVVGEHRVRWSDMHIELKLEEAAQVKLCALLLHFRLVLEWQY
jgi:hypothetical protein